jgi:GTP pyrophosphokinase
MELHAVDGKANGSMLVEVENLSHLEKIIRATRKVKGITDVARRDNVSAEE